MSEKLCLQWNDFKENVNSAFGRLRGDKEFTDVTLACEDGQQVEAHKVILAASSPFFEKILQKNKHPHPLIYLRGFQSQDLLAILDFLYFGEANIYQENFDSFLTIAEELRLKGLTGGQSLSDAINEQGHDANPEPEKEVFKKSLLLNKSAPTALGTRSQFNEDMEELNEKVKSMMEKSQNLIPNGKHPNGTPKWATAFICKVCGKEGHVSPIRNHIEANHLEGISIICDHCGKVCSSRNALGLHKGRFHR